MASGKRRLINAGTKKRLHVDATAWKGAPPVPLCQHPEPVVQVVVVSSISGSSD